MTFTIPKKQMSPLAVVEGANWNNLYEKKPRFVASSFISFSVYLFVHYFLSLSSEWSALRFDKHLDCFVQQTFNEDQDYFTKRYLEVI